MEQILSWSGWTTLFWGNTAIAYIQAVLSFVIFAVILFLVQQFLMTRLKHLSERTKTDIDNVVIRVIESLRPPLSLFLAAYIAIRTLVLNDLMHSIINTLLIILVTYQIVVTLRVVVDFVADGVFRVKSDAHAKVAVQLLGSIIKGLVWVFGILVVLSNLGIDVTSLIAGVGIGGIAIAFALQNILKDLFSSFSLYLEKPFSVGDFIVVGEHSGTVKNIGIKTTRIKSLGGEEIIISNSELTSSRVQNFKKMKRRRVSKEFGVTYNTPNEKLEKIPTIMKEIISSIENTTFGRAHFKNFEESALSFECVYFVETSDYDVYMDVKQIFNLGLKEAFEREGIEFAFPTKTVYIKESKSDL